MTYILKNKNLEIHIDDPHENYNFSRFDWTGKITSVKFQNKLLSSIEQTNPQNENYLGKGFYNEFGIDSALGFEETEVGGWFHKIGVGLLKKDSSQYAFDANYEITPAEFEIFPKPNSVLIHCKSEAVNGYAYVLKKEIKLLESGFSITYHLQNTGKKDIATEEYNHNFIAINKALIGTQYSLKFPFQLNLELFDEFVNPEHKVSIGQHTIQFNSTPKKQFFFSNLTGSKNVNAAWELVHHKSKIGIQEIGNFQTNKVNLWGWKHVISPELFFKIVVESGQSTEWSRTYNIFETK